MKHYLRRTLFYGIAAGICIPLAVFVSAYFVLLFVVIFLVFVNAELASRDPENQDAKLQERDKKWLFALLALSGVGLPVIYVTIYFLSSGVGDSSYIILFFTCPIAIIYLIFAFAALLKVFSNRSNEILAGVTKSSDEESTE
jgi:hypothetical protein